MNTEIRPLHRSIRGSRDLRMRGSQAPRPRGMARVAVNDEERVTLESIALGIFADMTNAGCSFQEALASIYLSGLQHAVALTKESK